MSFSLAAMQHSGDRVHLVWMGGVLTLFFGLSWLLLG